MEHVIVALVPCNLQIWTRAILIIIRSKDIELRKNKTVQV